MSYMKKIVNALISVYSKDNIDGLLSELSKQNISIFATGGTYNYIHSSKYVNNVTKVEDITGYPSILGGRVKTLHPKVFGGILNRRDNQNDMNDVDKYDISAIDLVVVDLYPFEEAVRNHCTDDEIIEKIDIGGISLIRAAAKNYNDVVIISSMEQIIELVEVLKSNGGATSLEYRKKMAAAAFSVTSNYDIAIFNYFNKENIVEGYKLSFSGSTLLRYGENPHQNGIFYGDLSKVFTQLHGKEISYNNLVDIDSGLRLISEFHKPAVAIIKHTNACGLAVRKDLLSAWIDAIAGDPVSAFGGVIVVNGLVNDIALANEINKLFFEIIIADDFSEDVLHILQSKKNRIILKRNNNNVFGEKVFKSVLNGVLIQDYDRVTDSIEDFNYATENKPDKIEAENLIFANILVKHTKSNAIVLAKNMQLIGSGTGQTSRVDALKQAIAKAKAFNFDLKGAVMASDAYFPFSDCVEIAHSEGIDVIIQPGGSIRDKDSIDYCNNNNMKMVFTGHRHFKH